MKGKKTKFLSNEKWNADKDINILKTLLQSVKF